VTFTSDDMKNTKLNLVGHPFIPIGMGEHIRATYRALQSVSQACTLTDIFGLTEPSAEDQSEFGANCSSEAGDINLYHINGNEVEQTFNHLKQKRRWSGYNIIYPLWELAKYPAVWAAQLDRFDEIWAPSEFVFNALSNACEKPVLHMPMSCEVKISAFFGRRYFNIPETAYVFLFFYDLRSFTSRKNPRAVIEAFRLTLAARPYSSAHLVIKIQGIEMKPQEYEALRIELKEFGAHLTLIDTVMTSSEVKNLMRCADCFVSLHRSEGYGFGLAEAMVLGKPVLGTAYSGNMDFMSPAASFAINYKLISVGENDYPHYHNQVWAEPDTCHASNIMIRLLDAPDLGRAVGGVAKQHMQTNFSFRKIGLNYTRRFDEIFETLSE
jgi:glycosyltransferase involved in cell wall biosynthesis